MNDPSVAVSPKDTAQTRGDRGHAEGLARETIMRFRIWAAPGRPRLTVSPR